MRFSKKQIPNILTIVRVLFVPLIVAFLLAGFGPTVYSIDTMVKADFRLSFLLAGIIFVIASLTDFIDGYLARKYNWVSDFGKLWDPVADKLLINSVLICFAYLHMIPIWVPIIMIARDIIVDATRMVAATKNVVIAANYYGKLKTITQMFAIIFIFFFFNEVAGESTTLGWWAIQNLLIFLATFFSVLSGIIYVVSFYRGQHAQL